MLTKYLQYSFIITEGEPREILLALLENEGFYGFEETSQKLVAYTEQESFNEAAFLENFAAYNFIKEEVANINWNEEWEKNFAPVAVDDFVYVRADFHLPVKGYKHEIIINPKMSFGTGHHATTYLVLQQMQGIDFNKKAVFDFGTGTGILSIMAEKLGAASVKAIDNDIWSIENAMENAAINHCNAIAYSLSGDISMQGSFDVILANINKNVILDNLQALKGVLRQYSCILLSGLLLADEEDIKNALIKNDLFFIETKQKDGWICIKAEQRNVRKD